METNFLKNINMMIQKSITNLILTKLTSPYGLHLLAYEIVPMDNFPIKKADALIDIYSKVIIINCSEGATLHKFQDKQKYLTFVLLHEIMHEIFQHRFRINNRNDMIWNIAGDYVINHVIEVLSLLFAQEKNRMNLYLDVHQNTLYKKNFYFNNKFDNMCEEEIYSKLTNNVKIKKQNIKFTYEKENGKENEIEIEEQITNINGKEYIQYKVKVPEEMDAETVKQIEQEHFDSTELTKQLIVSQKGEGTIKYQQILNKIYKVKVDWEKITKDCLATALQKSTDLCWSRPSYSYLANYPSIGYRPTYAEEEELGTVFFAIDESASVSNKDVKKAFEIVYQSRSYFKNLFVLKHDSTITWEKFYDDIETVDFDEINIRRSNGGTSHHDVFNRVVKFIKKDYNKLISCVICITDMESDIQTCQKLLPINIPIMYITSSTNKFNDIRGRIIRIN